MTGPRIDHYTWPGGREAMLRFGPDDGATVIAALPLFEEANRTRAFAGTILRALGARGIGGALPDMPGQGESLVPLSETSLAQMADAFASAAAGLRTQDRRVYSLAVRSGALLDRGAALDGRWHLAPQDGPALARELARIRQASGGGSEEIAGNRIGAAMLDELARKQPMATGLVRTVRLNGDPRPADEYFSGAPLWRRSEPDNDPALAASLADDIAGWTARCGG